MFQTSMKIAVGMAALALTGGILSAQAVPAAEPVVVVSADATPATRPVVAQSPESLKQEMRSLLRQRTELRERLATLDRQAADAMKQGKEPVVIWAQQTSIQDRLDLMEMRLDVLSARTGVALPEDQTKPADPEKRAADERAAAMKFFEPGRARAVGVLREDTLAFLAQLDFRPFLENLAPDAAPAKTTTP